MMQNRDGGWGRSAPTEEEAATREVDQSVRRRQLAGIDPPAGLKYSDAKFALVNPRTGSLHVRHGTSSFATAVQAGSRARPRLAARRPRAGCVPSRGGARVMELRWLQDFLMVAETGNFTRAAERRNTSQAAFSRRIKSLEAWLGFDLIDRSVYPTQLTPQGERFREHAGELLKQMLDTRDELGGKPVRRHEHIRIALPFAMATARLPHWWQLWSQERRLSCSVVVGNIHDLVTSLVSNNVDLMICHHHAQQPIHLDPDRYERVILGTEFLPPYAREALAAKGGVSLPGRASHPVPLLMYSPG